MPILEGIASSSAFLGDTIIHPSPCGTNCFYEISFNAPAYSCVDVPFVDTPWKSDNILRVSWVEDGEVGNRTIYASEASRGNIWFAASYLRDELRVINPVFEGPGRKVDTAEKVRDTDFVFQAIQCTDWNATYHTVLSFNGTGSSIRVRERQLLNPIDYVDEPKLAYQEFNKAIHGLMASWLEGNITLNTTRNSNKPTVPQSLILPKTRLVNHSQPFGDDEAAYYYAIPNLRAAVQELHMNATLSFLSASENFYFMMGDTDHECQLLQSVNIYQYDPERLIAVYAAATGATLISFLLGIWAVWSNGARHSDEIGAIIAATRNLELDSLAEGTIIGGQSLSRRLKDAWLTFGNIAGPGEIVAHYAFGTQARNIRKQEPYY